ncbi:hypothetical protein [Botrimarina mediterranea]|uniref:hypothetical protein n=1 Tax=Botrimarina mediterranea TaxID=2528022 RepID=UPI0011A92626|nr:hypothetical protein [Botrimarina mediterranea]
MAASIVNDTSVASRPLSYAALWAPLAVALATPLLFLQAAVVKPMSADLDRMQRQVARLEATIAELKSKGPVARQATGLLAELTQQESLITAAERSLERFAMLDRKMTRGLADAEHAIAKLDRLEVISDRAREQARLLDATNQTLVMLQPVADDLQNAIDRAGRLAPAVTEVERLSSRLGEAQGLTEASLRSVDKLVDMQQTIASRTAGVASANAALEGLLRMESRLNSPLLAVAASQTRLDELIRLKDVVIAKTDDLPAAFDTFDLIVGLQDDLQQARVVFERAQRLVADLTLLSPSLKRLATVIEPMIEQATVKSLAGAELRMVLKELGQRRSEALAKAQSEAAEDDSVATRPAAAMK